MKSLVYALRTQATVRAAAHARQQKPQPWPRPRYPTAEAIHYYRLLKYWVELVQYIVKRDIVPILPDILAQAPMPTALPQPRTDAAGKTIDQAFADAEAEAAAAIPDPVIQRGAQQTALRVTEWNANELNKQVQKVAKINLYDNTTGLAEHLELFVSDNVKLIKSVAFGQLDDLKGVVTRGARAGLRHTEVAAQIEKQFGVTKRRAAVIARDQVGKLNGEMNQLRQQNLGVRRYRWSTSQDERVRDSHRSLNGTIQEWAKPPVVDPRTGERGHPGQPIQCRCSAIPIIDDVLADAGLIDPVDVELTHPSWGPQQALRPVRPPPAPMPPTPPKAPPPVAPPPELPLVRPPAFKAPAGMPSDAELKAVQKAVAANQQRAARSREARAARQRGSAEAALHTQLTASEAERAAEIAAEQAAVRQAERSASLTFRRAAAAKRKAAKRRTVPPPKKRKRKPRRAS